MCASCTAHIPYVDNGFKLLRKPPSYCWMASKLNHFLVFCVSAEPATLLAAADDFGLLKIFAALHTWRFKLTASTLLTDSLYSFLATGEDFGSLRPAAASSFAVVKADPKGSALVFGRVT
jgi:hypothetical protein